MKTQTFLTSLLLSAVAILSVISCKPEDKPIVIDKSEITRLQSSDVPDIEKFHQPSEFKFDFLDCNSKWSWWRSKQSEHFIIFWASAYGKYGLYAEKADQEISSPSTLSKTDEFYVDIDDVLEKAEHFYDYYVNRLGFLEPGKGTSCVDKYKIQIYLNHDSEWLATGAGYDNTIGALWVSPATCKPVGATIAHEIAHCFQYMVYCDQLLAGQKDDSTRAFRFSHGKGSGFWEQCAQWQAYQMYASEAFGGWFSVFTENAHRHFLHEDHRYGSYFLQWYWAEKHGEKIISQIWKNSGQPDDALQTYMKVTGLSLDGLNQELYEYAARCVSWDFSATSFSYAPGQLTGEAKAVREYGKDQIGKFAWKGLYDRERNLYMVDPSKAPEATGFNHIRLNHPEDGGALSVTFRPEMDAAGYGPVGQASEAAWTVGFVELGPDGSRTYSPSQTVNSETTLTYTASRQDSSLWLVICCTPSAYKTHLWDDDNSNDVHWPYSLSFKGTDLYGNIAFDGSETVSDASINYKAKLSASAGYSGPRIPIEGKELRTLAKAMVMQPSDIFSAFPQDREEIHDSAVKIAAVQADGSLSYDYTAYGYGFWYDAEGNVTDWEHGYVFMEFHPESRDCYFGVHPYRVSEGKIIPGDVYKTSFAIVYGENKTVFSYEFTIVK